MDPRDILEVVARSSASGATARAARHGRGDDGAHGEDEGLVHVAHLPARTPDVVAVPALGQVVASRLDLLGIQGLYRQPVRHGGGSACLLRSLGV